MTKNILCIVVDRLRASAIGAYGGSLCETPHLDRMASNSFLFDQYFASSVSLERLHRSLWQSAHPLRPEGYGAERVNLAEAAAKSGATPVLFSDDSDVLNHPLANEFADREQLPSSSDVGNAESIEQTQIAHFFAGVIDLLESLSSEQGPFVLWAHCQGMQGPWDAPLELRRSLADPEDPPPPDDVAPPSWRLGEEYDPDEVLAVVQSYGGQILLLDECLGILDAHLTASGLYENTLVMFAGARGLPLGEHGRLGVCDSALYSEALHVPLMVRMPEGIGAGARSNALASSPDLYPTLLSVLGESVPEPANLDGADLAPLLRGEADEIDDRVLFAEGDERGFRTPAWYLRAPESKSHQLYLKPDDRWEANDVADRCGEVARKMHEAALACEEMLTSPKPHQFAPLDQTLLTHPE